MTFIQQIHIYILHQTYEYHLSHTAGLRMIVEKTNIFSFCEINATKFGTKIRFHLISFGLYHAVEIDHTLLLLLVVAAKVLLILVISLTVHV